MTALTPGQARIRHRRAFEEFYRAYPRKIGPTEAERAFADLCERERDPHFPEMLIAKARAYASSVNYNDLTYVPGPASWLKAGRWQDEDLFTNQAEQEREWFRQCWREGNVRAVENRYHVTYDKQYPPEGMTDPDAIALWYRETARAWITKTFEETIACREQKPPKTSSQNSQ